MLRRVALVRTDVSDELSASIIRVTRINEIGTTLVVTSNRRALFLRSVRRLLVVANVPVWKTEINDRAGSAALTTRHPSIHKSLH
jgi:hypothetical protein